MTRQPPYLEFAVASNFSFLRGASHPEELMVQAAHAGLAGIGLADRNTVAGVVRAHLARREHDLPLAYHPGARLVFADGTPDVLAFPRDRAGWGRLTRLLTLGNLRGKKGECVLTREDLIAHVFGLELVAMPFSSSPPPERGRSDREAIRVGVNSNARSEDDPHPTPPPFRGRERAVHAAKQHIRLLRELRSAAPGRVRLAATMLYRGNDRARLARLKEIAREAGVPLIAVNDVHMHHPDRRPLADVLTCIREKTTIDRAGRLLAANAERYLKPPEEMARLFRDAPEAIEETWALSDALTFSLDELKYEYPDEQIEGFASPQEALEHLTWQGATRRYPDGLDDAIRASIANEFALIGQLGYAPYFLTVYDIVKFARSQGILCQGRGSAANSTVCYCLGITEVDPVRGGLLFERFISPERREPPDIDVDFEHERREEVIQYIYRKYGRERAGIAATVISYRGRSAIREVGKAFGLSEDAIGALSSSIWGGGGGAGAVSRDAVTRTGLDPHSPRMRKVLALAAEINGFPRHLSQHVGGFVITRSRLDEVMPIGNAAMADRTFVEWDKDDLDALGILKIDVLGLGMLSCLRKALDLVGRHYPSSLPSPLWGGSTAEGGRGGGPSITATPLPNPPPSQVGLARLAHDNSQPGRARVAWGREHAVLAASAAKEAPRLDLSSIPPEDPAVYDMLCRADSLGVFQVESRAQMTMLPRLRPRMFYDLVIEVAIVRPGPIQGDMVHPYLRRRQGLEAVSYPKDELKTVLGKTLGVPLFQEQAMKIAIVAAGFTPAEADKLRRAMATFKRVGTIGTFQRKMIDGMLKNGYARDFAERCFQQIEGFGEYGFPESHAASFALLVYASAWLKCRYPDAFAAALLNAQPMGFYAPSQIVRDAREHGVEVRPPDINFSDWDSTLEPGEVAAERLHELHKEMRGDVRTTHAIRLGLREIKGLREEDARWIVERRTCPGRSAASQPKYEDPALYMSPQAPDAPHVPSPLVGEGSSALQQQILGEGVKLPPHPSECAVTFSMPSPTRGEGTTTAADFSSTPLENSDSFSPAREEGNYDSVRDVWLRTGLPPRVLERLADADAFGSLGLKRRDALWAAKALGRVGDRDDDLPLFAAPRVPGAAQHERSDVMRCRPGTQLAFEETGVPDQRCSTSCRTASGTQEPEVALPPMPIGEEVVNDYRFLRLSLRAHPSQFLRDDLAARGILRNEALRTTATGARATVSGLVTCRQRPGSANGVIFMTIEDETAMANIIVWPKTFERLRPIVLGARYVSVRGKVQQESGVIHVVAEHIEDLTHLLARLTEHGAEIDALARCDEVRRPVEEPRQARANGGRESRLERLMREMPDLAADLDTTARGSAHAPSRKAG